MSVESNQDIPDISDIHLAHARIRDRVRPTPILNDPGLDEVLGCQIHFKCENFQRTGAFKFRGASNAIARLREQGIDGPVATHSSGNHGAALALAARLDNRAAHVVMPENSSRMKIAAVRSYGGEVHFCAPNDTARSQGVDRLIEQGMIAIHPYDHPDIIAGQGTAALEFEQELPTLEQIICPLGGGGLISGTAIAVRVWGAAVYGVEPEGAADTVSSLQMGRIVDSYQPDTIADGLRAIVGVRNFQVIRNEVKGVLTVSDDEIRQGMVLLWKHLRILIEPSSATVIAAVSKHPEIFGGKRVGAILTGGNVHPADWMEISGLGSPDS